MKAERVLRRGGRSLKSVLLLSLLPALALLMTAALWLSNHQLRVQINQAYDRSLAGALRSIDHQISTESGGLSVELPYLMLQFFELTANESVYYRVLTEDGLAEIGNQALPLPDERLVSGVPFFYTADYLGQRIRIAALARRMDPPLNANPKERVIVLVGEDVASREAFIGSMMWRSAGRDALGVILVILIVAAGVLGALRPLTRLEQELRGRRPDNFSPVEGRDIPAEVQPLVNAVNLHMERYARQARLQSQFLDDASHQLRTPLSVLRMQLGYALRESDPAEIRAALLAMQDGLERAERTASQLLALARAKDAPMQNEAPERTDLGDLARSIVRELYPAARARRQDLGLDCPAEPLWLAAPEWLLRQAVSNLLDNALRYTPEGGMVTLAVSGDARAARVMVEDNGPGMTADDIEKAGVRFRRGRAGRNTSGAGLGLAIVHAIMQQLGGEFRLESPGRGCRATLVFTLGSPTGRPAAPRKTGN